MKVTNGAADRGDNDHNEPLTTSELEALAQFEASDRSGQVLFRPRVASGEPKPYCLVFLEGICRFGLMFLDGDYSVQDGQWYHRERADDAPTPVDNPLEEAWQRAMAAKGELRKELDIGAFFVPVVIFTAMEPDDDILDERRGRRVRVLWGMEELLERLIDLPDREDLHPRLNNRFIEKEIGVLSRRVSRAAPASEQMTLELPGAGQLVLQINVYVYVTVAPNGDGGDAAFRIVVQGQ